MSALSFGIRFMILVGLAFVATTTFYGNSEGESPEERLLQLRSAIAYHDQLYYREGRSEISDAAYDRLVMELAELKTLNPHLSDRLKQAEEIIGPELVPVDSSTRHRVRMLSLRKGHTGADVHVFHERLIRETGEATPKICVEPKIDGMAVSLIYRDGQFERALTRGNGSEGEDVTQNVRALENFPDSFQIDCASSLPQYVELRGELFIRPSDFRRLNATRIATGQSPFSTERNLAAGTILGDNPEWVAERSLRLHVFDWGAWEPMDSQPDSQEAFLKQAHGWGLPVVESFGCSSEVDSLLELMESSREAAEDIDLPLDGLVLKVNEVRLRECLGRSADSPNWALAYKFAPREVVTELVGVTFQISRSGRLNPVAVLEPVTLDGRCISRASLHNWAFIREHDLRVGDTLVLALSGDVIPRLSGLKAIESDPGFPQVPFPFKCPECGLPVDYSDEMESGICLNRNCVGRIREEVVYFAKVLGIRGLGVETARRLVEESLVSSPADLFQLEDKQDGICEIIGQKAGVQLLEAIEAVRTQPLHRFIEALGIPGIGPAGAMRVAEAFGSWGALLDWDPGGPSWSSSGLDSNLMKKLDDYLDDPQNRLLVRRLADILSSSVGEDSGPVPSAATQHSQFLQIPAS